MESNNNQDISEDDEIKALIYIQAYNILLHSEESSIYQKFYAAIQEMEIIHPNNYQPDPSKKKKEKLRINKQTNEVLRIFKPISEIDDSIKVFLYHPNSINLTKLRQCLLDGFQIRDTPTRIFSKMSENIQALSRRREIHENSFRIPVSGERIEDWFEAFQVLNFLSSIFVKHDNKLHKETRNSWRYGFLKAFIPENTLQNDHTLIMNLKISIIAAIQTLKLREWWSPRMIDVIRAADDTHQVRTDITHEPAEHYLVEGYYNMLKNDAFKRVLEFQKVYQHLGFKG